MSAAVDKLAGAVERTAARQGWRCFTEDGSGRERGGFGFSGGSSRYATIERTCAIHDHVAIDEFTAVWTFDPEQECDCEIDGRTYKVRVSDHPMLYDCDVSVVPAANASPDDVVGARGFAAWLKARS